MKRGWLRKNLMSLLVAGACAGLGACTRHTVDVQPIRVEPIHLTVDINLRIDRELDEFFDFQRLPTTAPAPQAPSELDPRVQPDVPAADPVQAPTVAPPPSNQAHPEISPGGAL